MTLKPFQEIDVLENKEFNEKAEKASIQEEAKHVVKEYKRIIRLQKKRILSIAFCHGKIFKRYKDSKRFEKMLKRTRRQEGHSLFQNKTSQKFREISGAKDIIFITKFY